jgi:hypothetical protein
MTLPEKMTAFKKNFEAKAPKEVLEIMHRAQQNLVDSGILEGVPKAGDKAPDFTLKNTEGLPVALSGMLKKGPVVLGFYRGRW